MNQNISGIILSGGKSSRMGEEKGLINFRGRPLIHYVLELLKEVTTDIIIVANQYVNTYRSFGVPVIQDVVQNKGPIGGLHAGLQAINNNVAWVISCDMPYLTLGLLEYISSFQKGNDITIPIHSNEHLEPLCAIYSKRIIPVLEERIKNNQLKLTQLISDIGIKTQQIKISEKLDFYNPDLFLNINSKDELKLNE